MFKRTLRFHPSLLAPTLMEGKSTTIRLCRPSHHLFHRGEFASGIFGSNGVTVPLLITADTVTKIFSELTDGEAQESGWSTAEEAVAGLRDSYYHDLKLTDTAATIRCQPLGRQDVPTSQSLQREQRRATGQVDDLLALLREGKTTFVSVVTKRAAEDLSGYLADEGIAARYFHAEIAPEHRYAKLNELADGTTKVLVLTDGRLPLPNVPVVAILDADRSGLTRNKQAFLRLASYADERLLVFTDRATPTLTVAFPELFVSSPLA